MKYVIYTRVSDEKQKGGTSPDTQLEDCLKHIGRCQYEHVHDTNKGGIPVIKRTVLLDAISLLQKGDVLLCSSPDRLCRSIEEMGAIRHLVREQKGTIEFVKGNSNVDELNPWEWYTHQILGLQPEMERRVMAHRVKRAHKSKREKGEFMGFVPYGKRRIGTQIVEDEEERKQIDFMICRREEGVPYREIAAEMKERNMLNREGRPWNFRSIQRILAREIARPGGS